MNKFNTNGTLGINTGGNEFEYIPVESGCPEWHMVLPGCKYYPFPQTPYREWATPSSYLHRPDRTLYYEYSGHLPLSISIWVNGGKGQIRECFSPSKLTAYPSGRSYLDL